MKTLTQRMQLLTPSEMVALEADFILPALEELARRQARSGHRPRVPRLLRDHIRL